MSKQHLSYIYLVKNIDLLIAKFVQLVNAASYFAGF